MNRIKHAIHEAVGLKNSILNNPELMNSIELIVQHCVNTFQKEGRVLFCGNGGSAADAQHLAAELSGRYYFDREPLDAEALHVNTSYLTAVANDYSYDEIFSRLLKAKGRKGDVLIGFSTSGNSANVLKAFKTAREMEILTVGFTGETGGKIKEFSDILISIPSKDTPRIQEVHMFLGHIICEHIETTLFGDQKSH